MTIQRPATIQGVSPDEGIKIVPIKDAFKVGGHWCLRLPEGVEIVDTDEEQA